MGRREAAAKAKREAKAKAEDDVAAVVRAERSSSESEQDWRRGSAKARRRPPPLTVKQKMERNRLRAEELERRLLEVGTKELAKIEVAHREADAAARDAAASGQELAWTFDPYLGPCGYPVAPKSSDTPPFDCWEGWCRLALSVPPDGVISAGDTRWAEPKLPAWEWPYNMNNEYSDHYSHVPEGFTLRVWNPKNKDDVAPVSEYGIPPAGPRARETGVALSGRWF